MRIGNLDGRLVILTDAGAIDVERASGGRFGADPQAVYQRWAEFTAWAGSAGSGAADPFDSAVLGAPAPAPRQSFGIGLNYADHADESGFDVPDHPSVFTKFPSCITGPETEVILPPGGHTDWEVELVAVIGRTAREVSVSSAWDYVAGLSIGQDLSERTSQFAGPAPQFSLGKSFPGFAPVGPWLVTPESVENKDDLALGCAIDGETVQDGRTKDLIFPVASLISKLSHILTLYPSDLIFSGTPAGVGMGRTPQRFLQPGETLRTWIEGIGEIHQTFVG